MITALIPHDRYTDRVEIKVNFTLEQATKSRRGSRGIALPFPQPQRWKGLGGQSHAPAALPPGKRDPLPVV